MLRNLMILIGTSVLRSSIGWYTKSISDGKITVLEWKKLVETMTRISIIELIAFFGLNLFGADANVISISIGSYLFDLILYPIYKNIKIKFKL